MESIKTLKLLRSQAEARKPDAGKVSAMPGTG